MKIISAFLLLSVFSAWAGMPEARRAAKSAIPSGDLPSMRDWLSQPVAWREVVQTNITEKSAELVVAEADQAALLAKYGGSFTNSFEVNKAIVAQAILGYLQAGNIGSLTNAIADAATLAAGYEHLKNAGSAFDYPVTSYTNAVTVTEPTRFRWQDYGLTNAPTVSDLERQGAE